MLFTLDRGNVEMFIFILMTLFMYNYQKNNHIQAAIFLSLAISMKLYPGVFVVLYLLDKKYKNIMIIIITVGVVSIGSIALFKSEVINSLGGLQYNLAHFKQTYLVSADGLQHNSSLYGLLRLTLIEYFPVTHIINTYTIIALSIFSAITLYIVKIEKELWKRVALLTFMILLLPQVSFDYKLIHLIIVLCLFLQKRVSTGRDPWYAALLGLLLIPKDYYILFDDVSIAVLLNPLLMLIICCLIISEGFQLRMQNVTASCVPADGQ
jgi:hypothetical protein